MPPPDSPIPIGIVDPDPSSRIALARLLFALGYQATAFVSIAEFAADRAFARRCAVLFVDVRAWLEAGEAQRAPLTAGGAVVAVGDDARVEHIGRALAAGCADYLVRPVQSRLLLRSLFQFAGQAAAG